MTDTQEKTGLGNYFVANYQPFSFWKPAFLPQAHAALASVPSPQGPISTSAATSRNRRSAEAEVSGPDAITNDRVAEAVPDATRASRRRSCAWQDSNLRPCAPEAHALSPELQARGGQSIGRSPRRSPFQEV